MTLAFLLQTFASLIAILLLVALAAWARIARPTPALDETSALALIADEFPDLAPGPVWVAADGSAAAARAGEEALVVYRAGDGYVARSLPWARFMAGEAVGGVVALRLADIAAPRLRLKLGESGEWPPAVLAGKGAR